MTTQTAVLLGATGLIGEQVLQYLLQDDAFERVRILVRKPIEIIHPKLEIQIVNFANPEDFKAKLGAGDCIFCCIGTTQGKVKGDKNAYRKVDYDIPVHAARFGKEAGFTKYLFVSSVGADSSGGSFYLKLKGEVEEAITRQNFETLHIFQPGLLLGSRKEFRLGEIIGKGLINGFSFLLQGKYKKYRGIQSADVALAMVQAAKQSSQGKYVYENNAIIAMAATTDK